MAIDVDRLVSEIEVDPSKAIAGLKAYDVALGSAVRDRSADVDLDMGSALSELALFDLSATSATRDRTMNIDVDRNGSAVNALGSVASAAGNAGSALAGAAGNGGKFGSVITDAFGSAGRGAGLFGAVVAGTVVGLGPLIVAGIAIASILPGAFAAAAAGAGILLAALVPLVGLLGAIPAALGGLALVGGAVIGGLAGVVSGVSAYKDAASGAGDATEALAAKQDALRNAQQGLASAIRSVTTAQQALKDAQEDMAKAPLEAAEAIEDASFRRRQAIISEKRAILALQQAQENLSAAQNETARASMEVTQQTDEFTGKVFDVAVKTDDAVSSAREQRDALLAVEQAELDVARAQDESGDSARLLREMERKGIKNSDIMVAARRQLADAEWNLKQAHLGVANAQRQVAKAEKDLAKGAAGATAATQAWADAQEKLSDEGVRFVKFLADDFLPGLGDIGKGIQSEMLPGFQSGLEDLMGSFGDIKTELSEVGGMVGDTFADLMDFWTSPGQRPLLVSMFDNLNDVVQSGLDVLKPFSRVLVHITDAAAPMFSGILDSIAGKLDYLADAWDKKGGKNGLVQFFDDAQYFGGLWWDVLVGIWDVLEPIVNAGKPLAARWLKNMAGDLEDMGEYLASPKGQKMLTQFFEDAVPALKETWKFITGIADVLFNSSDGGKDSGFYKFMKSLNDDFVPALKEFFEDVDGSDLAGDLVSIFSAGVDFINALNNSGTIDALNALGDVLSAIAKGNPAGNAYNLDSNDPLLGMNPADFDEYDDRGYTEDTSTWDKFKDDLKDIFKGPEEGSPFAEKLDGWRESIRNTFSLDGIKAHWDLRTAETGQMWSDRLDTMKTKAANFAAGVSIEWTNIKEDWKEKWGDMTDFLGRKTANWTLDIQGFKDWIGELSWEGIFDGLGDAFYSVVEWIADMWNRTIGGLEVHKPGANWKIPEIDLNGAGGDGPSGPGSTNNPSADNAVGPTAPDSPTGVRGDRAPVQINNTFNEKVDPEHLSRALAWQLAS